VRQQAQASRNDHVAQEYIQSVFEVTDDTAPKMKRPPVCVSLICSSSFLCFDSALYQQKRRKERVIDFEQLQFYMDERGDPLVTFYLPPEVGGSCCRAMCRRALHFAILLKTWFFWVSFSEI
jgi:hypothetical protein